MNQAASRSWAMLRHSHMVMVDGKEHWVAHRHEVTEKIHDHAIESGREVRISEVNLHAYHNALKGKDE